MFKVYIEGFMVFEGAVRRVGGGGTKTAFELIGTDFVVLLPNMTDGQALVQIYDRICEDEIFYYNYLTSHQLLGLPILQCTVVSENLASETLALYAPAFAAYKNHLAHVIDKKSLFSLDVKLSQPLPKTINEWLLVFCPLMQDLERVVDNNICPWGDSYNLLWTEQGSKYHSGTGHYALRYFGFDFASKRFARSPLQPIENRHLVLQNALEEAVDIIFALFQVDEQQVDEQQVNTATLKLAIQKIFRALQGHSVVW